MASVRARDFVQERLVRPHLDVGLEAAGKTERTGNVRVVHEGGGVVAILQEGLGERRVESVKLGMLRGVTAFAGGPAGHDGHETAAGLGPVGVGLPKDRGLRRPLFEAGCGGSRVAVHAHVVGSQSVDGDENQGRAFLGDGCRCGAGGRNRAPRTSVGTEGEEGGKAESATHHRLISIRR